MDNAGPSNARMSERSDPKSQLRAAIIHVGDPSSTMTLEGSLIKLATALERDLEEHGPFIVDVLMQWHVFYFFLCICLFIHLLHIISFSLSLSLESMIASVADVTFCCYCLSSTQFIV